MKKLSYRQIELTLAVTFAFFSSTTSLMQIQVLSQQSTTSPDRQQTPTESDRPNRLIFIQPEAKDEGAPGRRQSGGTHGGNQCPLLNPPLTALVPGSEAPASGGEGGSISAIASKGVRGLTAEGYPTFWFYVPYSSASKLSAKFVLVNHKDEPVVQETYLLAGTPGIVKIRPSSISMSAPLEVGKNYRWSFSVICNPQDSSANTYVEGWVERVELNSNLTTQLKSATPQEKVFLYAKAGLWHETITTLIEELRSTNSRKAVLLLTSLLQSVSLNNIAQQPIVECCRLTNN